MSLLFGILTIYFNSITTLFYFKLHFSHLFINLMFGKQIFLLFFFNVRYFEKEKNNNSALNAGIPSVLNNAR